MTSRGRALAIAAALALPVGGAASIAFSAGASAQVADGPTLTGLTPQGTEGQSHDFRVATVSGLGNAQLTDISVDWGDSSPVSAGSLDGPQVRATHTYAEAGTYTITVNADAVTVAQDVAVPAGTPTTASPPATSVPLTTTATATIAEATVNLHHEKTQVVSGGAFDGAVAHGTDHNSAGSFSDFSAVIDWGDGGAAQTCTACIAPSGQDFTVSAAHQYTAAGVYTVATMVKDGGSDVREKPVKTRIIVPIVASAQSGSEGGTVSGALGTVIVPDVMPEVAAADDGTGDVTPSVSLPSINTVTINWGDGSDPTSGDVSDGGVVSGSHSYADEGSFTITLTGTDVVVPEVSVKKGPFVATNTVTIADAPLHGTPASDTAYSATQNTQFSAVLGSVVDSNANAPLSDLSATIDWGDGTTTAATLTAGSGPAVTARVPAIGNSISGAHTYTGSGTKNGTVHVVDVGGATTSFPFTVNVAAAQVQGITSTPTGGPTSGVQGILSTPNTGSDLPVTEAALLLLSGGTLFAVGRRRRR